MRLVKGKPTLGDAEGDELLARVLRNARVLASECGRTFYVWVHAVNGLSVNDQRPGRPFVEVPTSGAPIFHAREERRCTPC